MGTLIIHGIQRQRTTFCFCFNFLHFWTDGENDYIVHCNNIMTPITNFLLVCCPCLAYCGQATHIAILDLATQHNHLDHKRDVSSSLFWGAQKCLHVFHILPDSNWNPKLKLAVMKTTWASIHQWMLRTNLTMPAPWAFLLHSVFTMHITLSDNKV